MLKNYKGIGKVVSVIVENSRTPSGLLKSFWIVRNKMSSAMVLPLLNTVEFRNEMSV